MGKYETVTYECDDNRCNQIATIESSDETLPPNWVLIWHFKALINKKENVGDEGLFFCSPQHALTWFERAINPPKHVVEPPDG